VERLPEFSTEAMALPLEIVASERKSPVYRMNVVHKGWDGRHGDTEMRGRGEEGRQGDQEKGIAPSKLARGGCDVIDT
jgi:hypothetical protein